MAHKARDIKAHKILQDTRVKGKDRRDSRCRAIPPEDSVRQDTVRHPGPDSKDLNSKDLPEQAIREIEARMVVPTETDNKDLPEKAIRETGVRMVVLTETDRKDLPEKAIRETGARMVVLTETDNRDLPEKAIRETVVRMVVLMATDRRDRRVKAIKAREHVLPMAVSRAEAIMAEIPVDIPDLPDRDRVDLAAEALRMPARTRMISRITETDLRLESPQAKEEAVIERISISRFLTRR
jgi:hypothetical protein